MNKNEYQEELKYELLNDLEEIITPDEVEIYAAEMHINYDDEYNTVTLTINYK